MSVIVKYHKHDATGQQTSLETIKFANPEEKVSVVQMRIKEKEGIAVGQMIKLRNNRDGQVLNSEDNLTGLTFVEFEEVSASAAKTEGRANMFDNLVNSLENNGAQVNLNPQDQKKDIIELNKEKAKAHAQYQIQSQRPQDPMNSTQQYSQAPYRNTRMVLPEGYVCHRCYSQGHHIKDCPTNNDPNYDPHNGKGVPKNQQCDKMLGMHSEKFKKNRHKVFKALLTDSYIYSGKKVTSDGEEQKFQPPPSLCCKLCKNLLVDAMMTQCCLNQACFECINEGIKDEGNRCLICSKSIRLSDLIPNKKLREIIRWFKRQLLVNESPETIEIKIKSEEEQTQEKEQALQRIRLAELGQLDDEDEDDDDGNESVKHLELNQTPAKEVVEPIESAPIPAYAASRYVTPSISNSTMTPQTMVPVGMQMAGQYQFANYMQNQMMPRYPQYGMQPAPPAKDRRRSRSRSSSYKKKKRSKSRKTSKDRKRRHH